jgi:hypothetical protein
LQAQKLNDGSNDTIMEDADEAAPDITAEHAAAVARDWIQCPDDSWVIPVGKLATYRGFKTSINNVRYKLLQRYGLEVKPVVVEDVRFDKEKQKHTMVIECTVPNCFRPGLMYKKYSCNKGKTVFINAFMVRPGKTKPGVGGSSSSSVRSTDSAVLVISGSGGHCPVPVTRHSPAAATVVCAAAHTTWLQLYFTVGCSSSQTHKPWAPSRGSLAVRAVQLRGGLQGKGPLLSSPQG